MSRIHEALKKAEQERAPALPVGPGNESGLLHREAPVVEPAHSAVHAGTAVVTAPPDLLARDAVLAAARQTDWRTDANKLMFSNAQIQGFGPEQLRTLRSRLYQIRDRMPLKTLLVTSALPAEGKTFVVANLAQTFARQYERRILIIDADLRWSRMHSLLGAPQDPGLTAYLQDQASVADILQRGTPDNLYFIPGGKPAANPAELLHSGRFKKLLESVTPYFDWILIDSPPAVPVSDPSLMADLCDGVLLVVQAGVTPFDVAQKITQEYREKRLVGVVLNRIDKRKMDSAYGFSYYDYGRKEIAEKNGTKRG